MSQATLICALAIAMAFVGFGFGFAYFEMLRRTVELFATVRNWRGALVLTLGRLSAAVLLLTAAAKLGVATLLAALCGFLLARIVAVRAVRRSL